MRTAKPRVVGFELYFENLEAAKRFYRDTLGLELSEEQAGRYVKFHAQAGFLCLERKRSEPYPSPDKAVVFLEVANLRALLDSMSPDRVLEYHPGGESPRPPWAALHDPEGHNVVLLEARRRPLRKRRPSPR